MSNRLFGLMSELGQGCLVFSLEGPLRFSHAAATAVKKGLLAHQYYPEGVHFKTKGFSVKTQTAYCPIEI